MLLKVGLSTAVHALGSHWKQGDHRAGHGDFQRLFMGVRIKLISLLEAH